MKLDGEKLLADLDDEYWKVLGHVAISMDEKLVCERVIREIMRCIKSGDYTIGEEE